MRIRSTAIFVAIFLSAILCRADSTLTLEQYRGELDRLLAATERLDQSQIPQVLHGIPAKWAIQADDRSFEVSTEWLRHDLQNLEKKFDADYLSSIRAHLQEQRAEAEAYSKPPADVSAERARLNAILSRKEFGDIHGPTWWDRLKQRMIRALFKMLERIFGSSAIPVVGKMFVYVLIGIAVLALGFWAYRTIRSSVEVEHVVIDTDFVSAKQWSVWMVEAKEAAGQGRWRDAIHLAYWAGISFLEAQGAWRPDRARTPREYLRLMPKSSERHSTLTALTQSFEIVWYGNRHADAQAYSQTLQELEKLGCR